MVNVDYCRWTGRRVSGRLDHVGWQYYKHCLSNIIVIFSHRARINEAYSVLYTLTDKQQNIDLQSVEASSTDAITPTTQASPAPQTAARLSVAAVRRRDLKPSLMSHISGVHRLSSGVDGGAGANASATNLPKYGVDCSDCPLLDEVVTFTTYH